MIESSSYQKFIQTPGNSLCPVPGINTPGLSESSNPPIQPVSLEQECVLVSAELSRLKSHLLSLVSDKIKVAPFSMLDRGSSEFKSETSPKELRQLFLSIDKETQRLRNVFSVLLKPGCSASGIQESQKVNCRISDVFCLINDRLNEMVCNHQFRLIISQNLPELFLDPGQIGQVILNLVHNAAQYSRKGSLITLKVRYFRRQLLITVTDRGIGIPPQLLEKLINGSLISGGSLKNAGFSGLSFCRRIIESHGGKIRAKSRLGFGTLFSFTLPVVCVN
jgi:K+-sensing histidine kinase KdpD